MRHAQRVAGGGYGTDLHTIDTAAGYVRHIGDKMTAEVNNLWAALSVPGPTTWQSPSASQAFSNAQASWTDAHRKLMRAIEEIAHGLDDSKRIYDQADLDSHGGIVSAVRGLG